MLPMNFRHRCGLLGCRFKTHLPSFAGPDWAQLVLELMTSKSASEAYSSSRRYGGGFSPCMSAVLASSGTAMAAEEVVRSDGSVDTSKRNT